MLKEFKEFLTRGNLIEIAVGLILALAFKAIVDSVVADILTPIVAAVFGQPNFQSLTLDIGDGEIKYGVTANAIFSFVVIGFVLFLVMKAYNAIRREQPSEIEEEILLLREIRDSLRARS